MTEKDIKGRKYGKLTAIRKVGSDRWLFKCDCGKEKELSKYNVKSGHTKSCGCLKLKHGLYNTRVNRIWRGIKERCKNNKCINYQLYGGRGITVCEEWEEDFMSFYNWAIRNGYRDDLTIDRIDVNGNYCPENCRWTTPKEQANNRRNNKKITYKGETKTESQWEKTLGFGRSTFYNRRKLGWDIKNILETKQKKHNKKGSIPC